METPGFRIKGLTCQTCFLRPDLAAMLSFSRQNGYGRATMLMFLEAKWLWMKISPCLKFTDWITSLTGWNAATDWIFH